MTDPARTFQSPDFEPKPSTQPPYEPGVPTFAFERPFEEDISFVDAFAAGVAKVPVWELVGAFAYGSPQERVDEAREQTYREPPAPSDYWMAPGWSVAQTAEWQNNPKWRPWLAQAETPNELAHVMKALEPHMHLDDTWERGGTPALLGRIVGDPVIWMSARTWPLLAASLLVDAGLTAAAARVVPEDHEATIYMALGLVGALTAPFYYRKEVARYIARKMVKP